MKLDPFESMQLLLKKQTQRVLVSISINDPEYQPFHCLTHVRTGFHEQIATKSDVAYLSVDQVYFIHNMYVSFHLQNNANVANMGNAETSGRKRRVPTTRLIRVNGRSPKSLQAKSTPLCAEKTRLATQRQHTETAGVYTMMLALTQPIRDGFSSRQPRHTKVETFRARPSCRCLSGVVRRASSNITLLGN